MIGFLFKGLLGALTLGVLLVAAALMGIVLLYKFFALIIRMILAFFNGLIG
jgi:hypothetical protein